MSIRPYLALAIVLASPAARADDVDDGVKALIAASARHDAAAIAKLLDDRLVSYAGLWFADPTCAQSFGQPRELVIGDSREPLARCIAKLDLQPSTRKTSKPGSAIVIAKPGIEIAVGFYKAKIARIGYVVAGATPTISPALLEQQRISGTRKLAKPGSVSMAVCIDTHGDVQHSMPADAPTSGGLDLEAAKAIAGWKFHPFKLMGKTVPVLAIVRFGDDKMAETLPPTNFVHCHDDDENGVEGGVEGGVVGAPPPPPPPPPATPQLVAPTVLEGQRVAGNKNIVPDDDTKRQIQASGKDQIVGSFKLCVDTSGSVTTINMLKTTGFPAYDARIQKEMRTWKYRPYRVNGQVVSVCTAVTFIYTQLAAPQAGPTKP